MIVLEYSYKSSISKSRITEWIESKSCEKTSILKLKRYSTKITEDGFRIKEIRYSKDEPLFPQIIGKFEKDRLIIKIEPSIMGAVFFAIMWIFLPIILFCLNEIDINGVTTKLGLLEKYIGLIFILIVIIPVTALFIIRPNYSARSWIEEELQLTDRKTYSRR